MRISIHRILDQEIQARCCALFSRSHKSFGDNYKDTTKDQSSSFAKTYVSGYGHNSINDCGNICVSIERISMLAAKFIEDYPLFNGQESSTRYIRFDIGSFDDNVYCPYGEDSQEKKLQILLMDFYKKSIPIQQSYIQKINNISDSDMNNKLICNAVKAKAFDIVRGFLPAGCKTQVAWVTTFRQASDRIEMMLRHPLREIRDIGNDLQKKLIDIYPGAFAGLMNPKHISAADEYYNDNFWRFYHRPMISAENYINVIVGNNRVFSLDNILERPPSKKKLMIEDIFTDDIIINGSIDFAGWRDLHRHRNCKQMMPLLTAKEFDTFYIDNLCPSLKDDALKLINAVNFLNSTDVESDYDSQYYIPMGFKVLYTAKWSFSQIAYVLELRSKPTVHPTVRKFVKNIYDLIKDKMIPSSSIRKINFNDTDLESPTKINLERGKQA